jgi:hypothetical protein
VAVYGRNLSPPGFVPVAPVEGHWRYDYRHPTRFFWREDVARMVEELYARFGRNRIFVNTYHDHPEGYWRGTTSLDVWGPGGRDDPVHPYIGQQVFDFLFYYRGTPDIEWIIWRARMYGAWNGWYGEGFGYDQFTWHFDHVHVTYLGAQATEVRPGARPRL